jgi:hypothetical protein
MYGASYLHVQQAPLRGSECAGQTALLSIRGAATNGAIALAMRRRDRDAVPDTGWQHTVPVFDPDSCGQLAQPAPFDGSIQYSRPANSENSPHRSRYRHDHYRLGLPIHLARGNQPKTASASKTTSATWASLQRHSSSDERPDDRPKPGIAACATTRTPVDDSLPHRRRPRYAKN